MPVCVYVCVYMCAIFSRGGPQGPASFPLRFTGHMGRECGWGGVGGEQRYRKTEKGFQVQHCRSVLSGYSYMCTPTISNSL